MEFDLIFAPAEEILSDYEIFMTAYQIGLEIKERYPAVWQQLRDQYGEDVGSGAGVEYSWASQISRALDYARKHDEIQGLRKEYLSTEGITVEGIVPGNSDIAIWKV